MPTPSLPSTQPMPQAALEQIFDQRYEHEETRDLVALVDAATELVRSRARRRFANSPSRAAGGGTRRRTSSYSIPRGTCWSTPILRWRARTSSI